MKQEEEEEEEEHPTTAAVNTRATPEIVSENGTYIPEVQLGLFDAYGNRTTPAGKEMWRVQVNHPCLSMIETANTRTKRSSDAGEVFAVAVVVWSGCV